MAAVEMLSGPQFGPRYHGSTHPFSSGDLVEARHTTGKEVAAFATDDPKVAEDHVRSRLDYGRGQGSLFGMVYSVDRLPEDTVTQVKVPGAYNMEFSKQGYRVKGLHGFVYPSWAK